MEIQAALEAVTALAGPLVVVSDSTYVVNCFRDGWWRGWIDRDWVTSARKPVANRDLWEPLVAAVQEGEEITFRWVKGHSDDRMPASGDRRWVGEFAPAFRCPAPCHLIGLQRRHQSLENMAFPRGGFGQDAGGAGNECLYAGHPDQVGRIGIVG
jgi:hypothetical protein